MQFTRELAVHVRDLYIAAAVGIDSPALANSTASTKQLTKEAQAFGPVDRLSRVLTASKHAANQIPPLTSDWSWSCIHQAGASQHGAFIGSAGGVGSRSWSSSWQNGKSCGAQPLCRETRSSHNPAPATSVRLLAPAPALRHFAGLRRLPSLCHQRRFQHRLLHQHPQPRQPPQPAPAPTWCLRLLQRKLTRQTPSRQTVERSCASAPSECCSCSTVGQFNYPRIRRWPLSW